MTEDEIVSRHHSSHHRPPCGGDRCLCRDTLVLCELSIVILHVHTQYFYRQTVHNRGDLVICLMFGKLFLLVLNSL